MRGRGAAVCALLLSAACEEPPPQPTLAEVPAQYLGAWDESVGACGGGGPNAVTVTPTEVVRKTRRWRLPASHWMATQLRGWWGVLPGRDRNGTGRSGWRFPPTGGSSTS